MITKDSKITGTLKQMKRNLKSHTFAMAALVTATIGMFPISEAKAACGACTDCNTWRDYVVQEMNLHEQWMVDEWWEQYVKPAMQQFTDQVRDSVITNAMMIGAFLDGESELNSLRTLQELNATAMKDYAVSDTICKFGTLSRSLVNAQGRAKGTQMVLAERSQNRQLGHKNMSSAEGGAKDRIARYDQFIKDFCDPMDYGTAMGKICKTPPADKTQNIDINYTRLIDAKKTLDVDFMAGVAKAAPTDDEKAVIALANNLYAHNVFDRMEATEMGQSNATDNRSTYMDQRAIVAKRSVAENSFNTIVGMKAKGPTDPTGKVPPYIQNVLIQLGLSAADAKKFITDNPSYDAQMEILTKKLYQDPAFYANLMDTPANVERQYTALQSFGLMQRRDIFETLIRSEMLISMILEMEISKYQDDIQNRQNE